jgi:hypothetical protein
MPLMFSAALPVFVNATGRDLLELLFTVPNASMFGTSFTVPLVSAITEALDLVLSEIASAVNVTLGLAGMLAGAVYVMAASLAVLPGESAPHAAAHLTPSWTMLQFTPLFAGSLATCPANACVAFKGISAASGVTDTTIAGTTMLAKLDFVGSAIEVAVTVTVRSLAGAVAGALNVTEVMVAFVSVPPPDTVQVTPLYDGSFCASPVTFVLLPASTVPESGVTCTTIAA